MSLYNMLHGVDDTAGAALLLLIGSKPDDFGRFRDAWVEEDGRHVSVFTRCGGGNRDDYEHVFDAAREHPLYVADFDDDFDSTYATIRFRIPEEYWPIADQIKPAEKPPSLWDKTQAVISALKAGPQKPDGDSHA